MLLEKHAGHRATVAQVMGISERHVYRLISKYELVETGESATRSRAG